MPDFIRWTMVIFTLLFCLAGCSGLTGLPLGSTIDDANLKASVSQRLAAEKTSDFAGVKTDVKDRVVYLSGTVTSDEQKSRAENVIFTVPGIKGIVNNLQVEKR